MRPRKEEVLSIRDISRSEMSETRRRKGECASSWLRITFCPCVPCVPRKRRPFCETLNTAHKRGGPRSGLNDERELGHVANARDGAAMHARVGHGKNAESVRRFSVALLRSHKWSAENVDRVNTAWDKHERYSIRHEIHVAIHKSTNRVVVRKLNH